MRAVSDKYAAEIHPEPQHSEDGNTANIGSNLLSRRCINTPLVKAKAYGLFFARNFKLFMACVAVYLIVASVMTLVIFAIANSSEEDVREMTRTGVAAEIEYEIYIKLSEWSSQLPTLAITALSTANCSQMASSFPQLSAFALHGKKNPKRYYFDGAGKVASVYPMTDLLDPFQLGYDLIERNDEEYRRAMGKRGIVMSIPFAHYEGFFASYMQIPIWLPAETSEDDVGCNKFNDCSFGCWDQNRKMKFFGMIRALVNLDTLFASSASIIQRILNRYDLCILVKRQDSAESFFKIYCSALKLVDPVNRQFNLFGLTFVVKMTKYSETNDMFNDPWAPEWKYRLTIAVVVFIFPFCLLAFWAVASQEKYSRLLSSILPRRVINHLGMHIGVFSEEFNDVTILFSDICNFTPLATMLTPIQIVGMLDELYSIYDDLAKKHGVYKVETIGDAYMVSCGCPDKIEPKTAAIRMVAMAKDMLKAANSFRPIYLPEGIAFRVRVGMNSGGVVAGVVGRAMPRYCLFGDVVNTASRMESTCEPMKIQISESTYKLISESGIKTTPRNFVQVKGKGLMQTFYIDMSNDDVLIKQPHQKIARPVVKSKNVAFNWLHREDDSDTGSNKGGGFWSSFARSRSGSRESNSECILTINEHAMRSGFRSLTELPSGRKVSSTVGVRSSLKTDPPATSTSTELPQPSPLRHGYRCGALFDIHHCDSPSVLEGSEGASPMLSPAGSDAQLMKRS